MREPRILVNLCFFALLGVILAVWAVRSIISVDALERPFHVTADFATSPGLNSDLEVTHLGVRVGRVGDVQLRQGHVAVRLDLNRDARIPADVGARVLRKSAIGEPYIELTRPSLPARPGTAALREGDRIPLARTSGTVDYQELFAGLSTTLRSVDPRDARTLVHEAATGLEGRGTSIHDIIGDTHQLTQTLAGDAGTLDALSVELTRLTATLSGHRHQLASGTNDLATLTASVRQSRANLDIVLAEGPGLLRDANRLLRDARPGLGCLLTAAGTQTTPLLTNENSARVRHVLTMVPTLQALVTDVTARDASGAYLRVIPVITIGGSKAATEYNKPAPRPVPPAVRLCPATEKTSGKLTSARKPVARATPAAGSTLPAQRVNSTGEPSATGRWLPLLPPGIGAAVLLVVAVRAARTRFRTRR
ncbi:MCE family protein [Actinomadura craniellae]|uniref:MCE family protein n=1 Tax=Actinomadura craniellae TaxID=2231787 RepID=A0A365GZZ0_9ACTN|nr:MlaD family protein [Actinomadura craniellae]RAY12390.1 MCE family protein [Actinomadura craniellae]